MKCVIYARVSSKEQEKEGFSIPAQLKLCHQYAISNEFEVAEEFVDVETAKRAGRAAFGNMVSYLEKHPDCKAILVEKTDRLYRNIRDWVTLDEFEIHMHFVKEGTVLSQDSKSTEKFMHGIRVLMAKNYCDNLSEEVKKGLSEKAAQGKWPHRAPVGYVNDKATHTIIPDPKKSALIRELFEKYATGDYSLEKLAEIARDSGLFSRTSQAINKAGIHRILKNPIYCGEFDWKGKRYLGTHEAIITRKLYDAVQSVLSGGRSATPSVHSFAFSGLVKCGICGCAMTAEMKKGKYIYYHCTGYRGKCGNTYVNQNTLDQLFAEAVGRIRVDSNTVEDIKKALRASQKDQIAHRHQSTDSLRRRQSRLQGMLDKAYEDKLSGTISDELWERKSAEWQEELVKIRQQLGALENASADYYEMGVRILELANSAYGKYLQQSPEGKAKLLRKVLSNSTFTRGTLCPTYKNPFDILAERANFKSMRPQYHSPQTFVEFTIEVNTRYSTASGTRWKTIG